MNTVQEHERDGLVYLVDVITSERKQEEPFETLNYHTVICRVVLS